MNRRSTLLPEHPPMELTLPNFLREYGKMSSQCAAERVDHPGTCPGCLVLTRSVTTSTASVAVMRKMIALARVASPGCWLLSPLVPTAWPF